MRTITARYAGHCAECNATIPKGALVGYSVRRVYCVDCLSEYRRRLAADDDDMMTGGY